MDSGMSLSDIAAVTRGANDENGWGSGWFLIVVLFLFMFGFGGNGWNRQGEFGQYATAASQQEILFGQQFGQLNDRLTNIGNGICNLGYEMQGGIGQLGKEVALAQNGTNMAIMQTGNDIQRQMADCCCTTQRGLDAINANIDAKFAALELHDQRQQSHRCGRRHRAGRLDDAPLWLQHPSGRQRDYTVRAGLLPCQCQRDSCTHGCRYGQPDRTEGRRRHHRRYGSSDGRSKRRGKPHYYGYYS